MPGQVSTFLREFVRHPMRTGALVPSSAGLTRRMVSPIPEAGDPVVVELGPGTGACTAAIQARLGGRGHHLAVELNPRFAALIADRFSTVDVANADAGKLPHLLSERDLGRADTIVSGLPWAAFPADLQRSLLDAVTASLSPTGAFVTFAYLHALTLRPARRFRCRLGETFEEVVTSQTVWRNVPPALIYFARRPRRQNLRG